MTPEQEEWRLVPEFGGAYEASSFGRIRSSARGPARVLKPSADRKGYLRLTLASNGNRGTFLVHRVVALTFHGPCPEGLETAHLDGHPANNRADNLAYVTRSENMGHKRLHGTEQTGERHGQHKLTDDAVRFIRENPRIGYRRLAKRFGVSTITIRAVRVGESWTHIDPLRDTTMPVEPPMHVGRNQHTDKTECHLGHPLSGENLYVRRGWRICRTCQRAHHEAWKLRKRKGYCPIRALTPGPDHG